MNSDLNIRKVIGTSIISLVMVIVGLFLVCAIRGPRPVLEDMPLEAADISPDSVDSFTGDLLDYLDFVEDSASEPSLEAPSQKSSEDAEMSEILHLLDVGEVAEEKSIASDKLEKSRKTSAQRLSSVSKVVETPGASETGSQFEGFLTEKAFEELRNQVASLSKVLDSKNSELETLKKEIASYDEKVTALGTKPSGRGGSFSPPAYSSTSSTFSPEATSVASEALSGFAQQYQQALDEFQAHNYRSALQKFEKLLAQKSNHPLSDNCQYWIGECHFALGNYYQAIVEFQKVFSFDELDKTDDAQLMIGLAYMKSGNSGMARIEFDSLLIYYPESEYVSKARYYLAQLGG